MRLAAFVVLSAAVMLPRTCAAASPEEVVLGMARAINERDWGALASWVSDDVRRHSAATPGVVVNSRAEFEVFLKKDFETFPDAKQEVNRIFSSGDLVAVHGTYRGTQTGPMGSFPPTGRTMELPFIAVVRVEDDQVAEIWVEWDNLSALAQLGHFPPSSGDAATIEDETGIRSRVVPAACGQCQFGLEGEGCTLAVRIEGRAYFVEGSHIDDHGDAHAPDGFCQAVRNAEVTGSLKDGRFHAVAFRLLPTAAK